MVVCRDAIVQVPRWTFCGATVLACHSTCGYHTRRLMTSASSKQAGKGLSDGVTSEVATTFEAEKSVKKSSAQLRAILESVQTQAVAYFSPLGALTLLQIIKAQRLERAFRRVLGNPVATDALRHPALKSLLRQALCRP